MSVRLLRRVDDENSASSWVVQLCLWSMNPAVAFRGVSEAARCVVLTSGTLAPMDTFASEVRHTGSSYYDQQ